MTLRLTKRTALLAVTIGALSFLAGCGGGDDDPNAGLPPAPIASPTASAYAGTYNSRVILPEGRSGAIALTVSADGRATGTLTVTETARSRQATSFSFGVGTYAISGTIDPATGVFNMTGNIPGSGPFTITGTLPAPGNGYVGGSYTLTAGGQTFTGTFGTIPSPSPSASPTPSPSPAASPTPNPSPTPSPVPGAINELTITREGTGDHNNSHNGAYTVKVSASGFRIAAPITGVGTINIKCEDSSEKVLFSLNLDMTMGTGPLVSGTFPVRYGTENRTDTEALFTYQEYGFAENGGTTRSWQSYHGIDPQEGQIVVEQVDASKVRVRFENALVYPTAFQNGVGKLRVNGTVETTKIFFAD